MLNLDINKILLSKDKSVPRFMEIMLMVNYSIFVFSGGVNDFS